MAKDANKTKGTYINLEGVEIAWAKVHENQREFEAYTGSRFHKTYEEEDGMYSCDILLSDPVDVERVTETGLEVKPHAERPGVFVLKAKRKNQIKVQGEYKKIGPPELLYSAVEGDGAMTPLPESIQIGNGSIANVSLFARDFGGVKPSCDLRGIQVTKLVPYIPQGANVNAKGERSMFRPSEKAVATKLPSEGATEDTDEYGETL